MNMNEYQRLALVTANKALDEKEQLTNVALGLAGEAGEVADMIKKHLHQGHELDKQALAKELGDQLWYIALGCEVLGTTLEEVAAANIEKLRKRYPEGFNSQASINRSE